MRLTLCHACRPGSPFPLAATSFRIEQSLLATLDVSIGLLGVKWQAAFRSLYEYFRRRGGSSASSRLRGGELHPVFERWIRCKPGRRWGSRRVHFRVIDLTVGVIPDHDGVAAGQEALIVLNETIGDLVGKVLYFFLIDAVVHASIGDETMIFEVETIDRHVGGPLRGVRSLTYRDIEIRSCPNHLADLPQDFGDGLFAGFLPPFCGFFGDRAFRQDRGVARSAFSASLQRNLLHSVHCCLSGVRAGLLQPVDSLGSGVADLGHHRIGSLT